MLESDEIGPLFLIDRNYYLLWIAVALPRR
jgi:hypothetical protein